MISLIVTVFSDAVAAIFTNSFLELLFVGCAVFSGISTTGVLINGNPGY